MVYEFEDVCVVCGIELGEYLFDGFVCGVLDDLVVFVGVEEVE